MHMADALISPAIGGTMWVSSLGLAAYSAKKIKPEILERKIPLMGVLGAFVFAAQMINFSIPVTGSSGHLGGGLLLAILLGSPAAFIVMLSVLTVQSLFFADGGLLALGCNIFNLGFWPCFIVYPLIFKKIVGNQTDQKRIIIGSILASVVGLQLGAFGVVLQTHLSGISELPFNSFLLIMQPIHLAIGIVEGIVTAMLVSYVWKTRPEIMELSPQSYTKSKISVNPLIILLVIMTLITGGLLSWFASSHPDGLEWSMEKVSGREELESPKNIIHTSLAEIQEKTAILPDYNYWKNEETKNVVSQELEASEQWPSVNSGTSLSGIIGAGIVLLISCLIGVSLRIVRRKNE